METIIKQTTNFGNSAGVLLPKTWLDKNVRVTLLDTSIKTITKEVILILNDLDLIQEVMGVYLVGSYARGDNEADSDIDILVITRNTTKTIEEGMYHINLVSEKYLEKSLRVNIVHHYPIIHEAKPLINSELLNKYRKRITKKDIKNHLQETLLMIARNQKEIDEYLKLGKDRINDAVAYSLVLRLRSLYIVDCLLKNKLWKKDEFLKKVPGEIYERYIYVKENDDYKDETIDIDKALGLVREMKLMILKWQKGRRD